ncbi:ATPase [Sphingomonas piscis]|uniref:ATPase n=1 Tax=Sphingomonas piscis TaxID=2714943 RepID=A0A6G7YM97_9SPHN|nr:SRPBCC domain-containing protein [Sphingomonas piscis]QIK77861.1 ATPase [Sphingomonas piscis]
MGDTIMVDAPIARTAADTIRLERVLDASVETLWRYLTQAGLRSQWFAGGDDIGGEGPLKLVFDHDKLSDGPVPTPEEYAAHRHGVNQEQVLRFEPQKVLAYTFGEGRNGVATFELFPEGGKTRLVLTHSGIQSPTGATGFGSGWNSHLIVLQEKLAGRSVPDFWALHTRSRAAVGKALAA